MLRLLDIYDELIGYCDKKDKHPLPQSVCYFQ